MERKRCKVVMLPTDDVTNIIYCTQGANQGVPHYREYYGAAQKDMGDYYAHLYIVSDDEIEEGDWVYDELGGEVVRWYDGNNHDKYDKKIIATTNASLGLPSLPEAFIMKYCEKGGTVDEVDVEYETTQRVSVAGKTKGGRVNTIKITNVVTNPKVDSHNTITIHPIKDSWTREEVTQLIRKFSDEITPLELGSEQRYTDEWIKENL